jgi:hypothetical protein
MDGGSGSANGISVHGAENLMASENVIEVDPSDPLRYDRCTAVRFFENRTPAGVLIRGYDEATQGLASELETDAEDAFILGLIRNR